MPTTNKVRYGLKNVHYAKAAFDEEGNVTYNTPVRIPGAVSLSMDANGEPDKFYADDVDYFTLNNNSGYDGDLELALIPQDFLTDILHEDEDENGVLVENSEKDTEYFALMFEFTGDKRKIRHVLYKCTASRPSVEGQTMEDTKEVKTETLSLKATPLINGLVKAKTGDNVTTTVYDGWYDQVYMPADVAEETVEDEDEDSEEAEG